VGFQVAAHRAAVAERRVVAVGFQVAAHRAVVVERQAAADSQAAQAAGQAVAAGLAAGGVWGLAAVVHQMSLRR
jgi:hypothetical protein